MKKVLLPLLAVCCMAPVAAFAAHPLMTDGATTVEEKHFEAETAVEYHMIDLDGAKGKSFKIQETVTAGIIPKVDAYITVPFSSLSPDAGGSQSGLNDITIGAKWNFMKAGPAELAVKPTVVLPTGDEKKALGAGAAAFGAYLAASGEVDKQISVQANVGVMHQNAPDGGKSSNVFSVGAAGLFEATKELKVVAEVVYGSSDAEGAKGMTTLTAGGIYGLQKNIDIDFGVNYAIQDKNKDLGLLAGFTYKF